MCHHRPNADGRGLEVVVDGLALFAGAQSALETTLVGAFHCDGSARRGVAHNEGMAISVAERRRELKYCELDGRRARARLVVLAMDVGGQVVSTTQHFSGSLAHARAREKGWNLHFAEQAWR